MEPPIKRIELDNRAKSHDPTEPLTSLKLNPPGAPLKNSNVRMPKTLPVIKIQEKRKLNREILEQENLEPTYSQQPRQKQQKKQNNCTIGTSSNVKSLKRWGSYEIKREQTTPAAKNNEDNLIPELHDDGDSDDERSIQKYLDEVTFDFPTPEGKKVNRGAQSGNQSSPAITLSPESNIDQIIPLGPDVILNHLQNKLRSGTAATMTEMTAALVVILQNQKRHSEAISNVNQSILTRKRKEMRLKNFDPTQHNFPLKNKEDIEAFESCLAHEKNKHEFMEYVHDLLDAESERLKIKTTEDKISKQIRKSLEQIFDEKIALVFSWGGLKSEKQSLQSTKTMQAILACSATSFFKENKKEAAKALAAWLKNFNQVRKRYHKIESPKKKDISFDDKKSSGVQKDASNAERRCAEVISPKQKNISSSNQQSSEVQKDASNFERSSVSSGESSACCSSQSTQQKISLDNY